MPAPVCYLIVIGSMQDRIKRASTHLPLVWPIPVLGVFFTTASVFFFPVSTAPLVTPFFACPVAATAAKRTKKNGLKNTDQTWPGNQTKQSQLDKLRSIVQYPSALCCFFKFFASAEQIGLFESPLLRKAQL